MKLTEARPNVSLRPFTTLRAGGSAEWLAIAAHVDDLASLASRSQRSGQKTTYLGGGSNILPSDAGVNGLVIVNVAREIQIGQKGDVLADCGCRFQDLFLKTAQAGLTGLEFAVGIPGTLGGALVSNAGAYRSCISESLVAIEVVTTGVRQWVEPDYLQFSYRNSILRQENPPAICLLRVRLKLEHGLSNEIYGEAREYQRQRISKQPPPASAGSFFKNVENRVLAESLPTLPAALKAAAVVPAGYLIESVGLKGFRHGGAMFSEKHANFMLNVDDASASEIRSLAQFAKREVSSAHGVELEEEVLYLGDWSGFIADPISR